MKKTVKQWLDTLPKELRELIPSEIINSNYKVTSLSKAISCGFLWYNTRHFFNHDEHLANEFWNGISITLEHMEQLDQQDLKRN